MLEVISLGAGVQSTTMALMAARGEIEPIQWQRGKHGHVVDYCFEDIRQTKALVDRVLRSGALADPRFPDQTLHLRCPGAFPTP